MCNSILENVSYKMLAVFTIKIETGKKLDFLHSALKTVLNIYLLVLLPVCQAVCNTVISIYPTHVYIIYRTLHSPQ